MDDDNDLRFCCCLFLVGILYWLVRFVDRARMLRFFTVKYNSVRLADCRMRFEWCVAVTVGLLVERGREAAQTKYTLKQTLNMKLGLGHKQIHAQFNTNASTHCHIPEFHSN